MIFLTNPNNPTGRLIPEADLRALADLAERHGIWLVVDEVYAGLEWQGDRAPSIAGIYERGITTGSVSKALGLQGLRTGWLICRDRQRVRDGGILGEDVATTMAGKVNQVISVRRNTRLTSKKSSGPINRI